MKDDPIVEETRKIRNRIAARFNYDIEALGKHYQEAENLERQMKAKPTNKKDKPRIQSMTAV